jgi:hypothetical protein
MDHEECSIDSQEFAIFSRINELAERWGLKPYDIRATIEYRHDPRTNKITLGYESRPKDVDKAAKFTQMLASIGISGMDWDLDGTPQQIIDTLDDGLSRAPRSRTRP